MGGGLVVQVYDAAGNLVPAAMEKQAPRPTRAAPVRGPRFPVGDVVWVTLSSGAARVQVRIKGDLPDGRYLVARVDVGGREEGHRGPAKQEQLSRY